MLGLGLNVWPRGAGGAAAAAHEELITLATAAGAEALYDPDNPDTWTLRDDGTDLWYSAVADGLGNQPDLVQATAANQPKQLELSNGRFVWECRKSNFHMLADFAAAISQPFTIFLVGQRTNNPPQYFFDSDAATGGRAILGANSATDGDMWAGAWLSGASAITTLEMWHGNYDGASSELFINGTSAQTGNPGTNALGGVGILNKSPSSGTLNALNGVLGPVLIFPAAKTNAEMSDIRDHINANWPIGDTV